MDLAKLRRLAPAAVDAHRIEQSYARIAPNLDLLALDFFGLVERSSPVWAAVLPRNDRDRRACLAATLGWMVAHVQSETVLGSLVFRVGAGPAGATASRLNLGHLASALLESLGRTDPKWDEPTRNAWLRWCAWTAWCLRSGHEARQLGRIRADDAVDLDTRRPKALVPPTLVSAA